MQVFQFGAFIVKFNEIYQSDIAKHFLKNGSEDSRDLFM